MNLPVLTPVLPTNQAIGSFVRWRDEWLLVSTDSHGAHVGLFKLKWPRTTQLELLNPLTGKNRAVGGCWWGWARSVALLDQTTAVVVDCRLLGFLSGVGTAWCIDLATGRRRKLVRGWPPMTWSLLTKLWRMSRAKDYPPVALQSPNLLGWPTCAVGCANGDGCWIAEARGLVLLDFHRRHFAPRFGRDFFNLVGVALWPGDRLVLLEYVLGEEGTLWLLETASGNRTALVSGLPGVQAFAADPPNNRVFIALETTAGGQLLKFDLQQNHLTPVASLRQPRALALWDATTLGAATADGLVHIAV